MNQDIDPDCLFCRIISKEIAAACVYEDENVFAFLDHRPLFTQTLLVSIRERRDFLWRLTWHRSLRLLRTAITPAKNHKDDKQYR